mmetsp:Transcript_10673/g.26154  ORF Transcript_10673/g.26154 Transcript_10673/m.26154 type:complete len:84 (+) Transcript_10673:796-1047(+)
MSDLTMRPPGPDPVPTSARSIPSSAAMDLASGETAIRAPEDEDEDDDDEDAAGAGVGVGAGAWAGAGSASAAGAAAGESPPAE